MSDSHQHSAPPDDCDESTPMSPAKFPLLPAELICHIGGFLSLLDLGRARSTSKKLNELFTTVIERRLPAVISAESIHAFRDPKSDGGGSLQFEARFNLDEDVEMWRRLQLSDHQRLWKNLDDNLEFRRDIAAPFDENVVPLFPLARYPKGKEPTIDVWDFVLARPSDIGTSVLINQTTLAALHYLTSGVLWAVNGFISCLDSANLRELDMELFMELILKMNPTRLKIIFDCDKGQQPDRNLLTPIRTVLNKLANTKISSVKLLVRSPSQNDPMQDTISFHDIRKLIEGGIRVVDLAPGFFFFDNGIQMESFIAEFDSFLTFLHSFRSSLSKALVIYIRCVRQTPINVNQRVIKSFSGIHTIWNGINDNGTQIRIFIR